MPDITSLENSLIKHVRQLHDVRHRRTMQQCIVEGVRAISACLDSGWTPLHIFITDSHKIPEIWKAHDVISVSERVAQKISQASSPSGFVAVFAQPSLPPIDVAAGGLILEEMSDPGNVGTLIRCAAAFALPQVLLIGGVDPFSHKVLQSTAGTFTATRVYRFENYDALPDLSAGAPCCALVVRNGQHPEQLQRCSRWLVVGSEAHGISEKLLASCQERVTLPMPGQAESLNAAMAGAIACYALFGQVPA